MSKLFARCNICGDEFEVLDTDAEEEVFDHRDRKHNDRSINGMFTAFEKVEKRITAPWAGDASGGFGVMS